MKAKQYSEAELKKLLKTCKAIEREARELANTSYKIVESARLTADRNLGTKLERVTAPLMFSGMRLARHAFSAAEVQVSMMKTIKELEQLLKMKVQ